MIVKANDYINFFDQTDTFDFTPFFKVEIFRKTWGQGLFQGFA